MNQKTKIPEMALSFKEFLFQDRRNQIILATSAVAIVAQFVVFKYFYPYASFIHWDSFSYLRAASENLDVNTYMVGYSRFLRLFSVFVRSDTILILFQYLFLQCSALFLIFSSFYFYNPSKGTQYILLVFVVGNPLFLHLANLISSDCIFAALSLFWFTLLLWIIHQPSNRIIFWHTIILFIAFTVRYNALIFPFISLAAFWISRLSISKKIAGIATGVMLCGLFILYTSYKYKQLTGYWQYSPFSGWQLANNALYAYRYVDSADRKPVSKKFEALDNMVREYFDRTRDTKKFPFETIQASTFYMWSPELPLVRYKNQIFKKDTGTATELRKWASMGPFFKDYGANIIRQYPWHFAQYFLWPNANKYFAPPVEFLERYNSGRMDVTEQAKNWFGYKNQKVKIRLKDNKVWALDFYPFLSGIINVIMFFSLLCYILLQGWQYNKVFYKGVILAAILWLLNATFTIGASSVALRFQSFPILLSFIFIALLIDWMVNLIEILKMETKSQRSEVEEPKLNLPAKAVDRT